MKNHLVVIVIYIYCLIELFLNEINKVGMNNNSTVYIYIL